MKKFSIPGFYSKYKAFISFLRYYNEHRELFYADRTIDSSYDAYGTLLWRGGRDIPPMNSDIEMQDILHELEHFPQIELRHVFSNCLLNEELLQDYLCNKFVKENIRTQDKVILNHPLLIAYFKQYYPKIPIIYSTTINITDINAINTLTENNLYVLNYNYNNDNEYLKQLKYPKNIEILCGEPCIENCPNRLQHYISISKAVLEIPNTENDIIICPYGSYDLTSLEIMQRKNAITNQRVDELYDMGFEYFKISGRTLLIPTWLEMLLYYLALPENIPQIREKLLMEWW